MERPSSRNYCRPFTRSLNLISKINRALGLLLAICVAPFALPSASLTEGLAWQLKTPSGEIDHLLVSNVWLQVPGGTAATPFLSRGPFTATWTGFLNLELRGEYTFQADLNGSLKLFLNGENVLEATESGKQAGPGKKIRLKKGTNSILAEFASPAKGDSRLRLYWVPADGFQQPIPNRALTTSPFSEIMSQSQKRRHGRDLFLEHRCLNCHQARPGPPSELIREAPDFNELAGRRSEAWLAKWIEDPKAHRPAARMPRMLFDAKVPEKARAIASFLGSLKPNHSTAIASKSDPAQEAAGKDLYQKLKCQACHDLEGPGNREKISLLRAGENFLPGELIRYLEMPERGHPWTRMPNFRLSANEALQLAAALGADAKAASPATGPLVAEGKGLVEILGCLNCHALKGAAAPPFLAWPGGKKEQGCLAGKPNENSKAPFFGFSTTERESLAYFLAGGADSLTRDTPADFARREIQNLNCHGCHGQPEGFPSLELLGEKLKPEWMGAFISGGMNTKPRTWLESRMPAFPRYGKTIGAGLALAHGFPATTPPAEAVDSKKAEIGQTLVSAQGGFSCVSCHAVAGYAATEVFEAPGINLALSHARMQPDYFQRWLLNPAMIDPQTKMPVYFDSEGKSPLTEILDGDARKQIDALWHYLGLEDKMPAPKTAGN